MFSILIMVILIFKTDNMDNSKKSKIQFEKQLKTEINLQSLFIHQSILKTWHQTNTILLASMYQTFSEIITNLTLTFTKKN